MTHALQLQIPTEVQRFPRLDTVLMVEQFVQSHDGDFSRKQLWEHLPRSMMYQTFKLIIEYLLYSRKISIDKDGKVGWIFYPDRHTSEGLFWKKT